MRRSVVCLQRGNPGTCFVRYGSSSSTRVVHLSGAPKARLGPKQEQHDDGIFKNLQKSTSQPYPHFALLPKVMRNSDRIRASKQSTPSTILPFSAFNRRRGLIGEVFRNNKVSCFLLSPRQASECVSMAFGQWCQAVC